MQHPDHDALLCADLGHVGALLAVAAEHAPLLFERDGQHWRLAGFVRIVQRLAYALVPVFEPINLDRESGA